MINWNNLDTLTSFKELSEVERVNLAEVMSGANGAERVKDYSVPMTEDLTYNYAAKAVDDKVLAALAKLAKEAQLTIKYMPERSQMQQVRNSQQSYRSVSAEVTLVLVQCILHLRTGLRRTAHSRWKPNSSAMLTRMMQQQY